MRKANALRWFKVFTERNPLGTFVQAHSNVEAAHKAERDGRGKVLRVEYAS